MLLNWVLPSSVVKKNPTAICLFGQFSKMKPWFSWALPLAHHGHICIFTASAEFSELTNTNHFHHLSFSIGNCKLRTPWFQQAQPNWTPNHAGSPPATSEPAPMLSSCPCSPGLDWTRALLSSTPVPQAGGNVESQAVSAACSVLAANQTQTGQSVCLRDWGELNCLRKRLNRQQHPCSQTQVTKASSESLSTWAFPLPPLASLKSLPC